MAVTAADLQRRYPGPMIPPVRMTQALDEARGQIERIHGPAYPGDGKLFRMTWRLWPQTHVDMLGTRRSVESIERFALGEDPEDVLDVDQHVRLLGPRTIVPRLFRLFGTVTADLRPVNDELERDGMTLDLAATLLGLSTVEGWKVIDRIDAGGVPHRGPDEVEVIDGQPS